MVRVEFLTPIAAIKKIETDPLPALPVQRRRDASATGIRG